MKLHGSLLNLKERKNKIAYFALSTVDYILCFSEVSLCHFITEDFTVTDIPLNKLFSTPEL